jgi:hypothetical protein
MEKRLWKIINGPRAEKVFKENKSGPVPIREIILGPMKRYRKMNMAHNRKFPN